jgi:cell wall-associated NlpC family hydrolase
MMNLFTVCIVLALAAVTAEPARPHLAETFESEAIVHLTDKVHGVKFVGTGYWAVDQFNGKSVKKITFEGHPENGRHKVNLFNQNTKYNIKGTKACEAVEAGSTMPVMWTWLRNDAKFVGNLELGSNSYIMFQGENHKGKSVAVAVNDEGLPVFYRKEGKRFTLEMHFTSYVERQADAAVFEIPAACASAVVSWPTVPVEPTIEFDNSTLKAPMALSAVIAMAKSICTCGCPYVYGGNGPCCPGKSGYDCSGMTTRSYSAGGYSIPRTAAGQQGAGRSCTGGEQAGDLLFFGTPAYHVVMSLGGGQIAECPSTGNNCRITSWRSHNGGCRRIA